MEEKELVDLFYLYHEHSTLFSYKELHDMLSNSIYENKILRRLTQQRLLDIILDEPTFCTLLVSEHPLLNAVGQPDLKISRPIKTLIMASVYLGQLFVTGYFFDAQDNVSISQAGTQFLGTSAITALLCSLMMIPLKFIICLFLGGKDLNNRVSKEELEKYERNESCFLTSGAILLICWAGVCLWGITMFIMSFTTDAMLKWIVTFLLGIFCSQVLIFNLKLVTTILIALLLLKFARSRIMLSLASGCAGYIVDLFMRFFT